MELKYVVSQYTKDGKSGAEGAGRIKYETGYGRQ